MKNQRTLFITKAAIVASLYVVLTGVSALFGLDKGVIQFRLSEVLCILPFISFAAVPGVTIGCALSSLLFAANPFDILFGSIATLIGAVFTYTLRKKSIYLAILPPIISNTVIIPFIIKFAYGINGMLPYFALTVFAGELVCCGILGIILYKSLPKRLIDSIK
jgi:uncharacterized membrane protein